MNKKSFICATCGTKVIVGEKDKRTKFCSDRCSREYWRHKSRYDGSKTMKDYKSAYKEAIKFIEQERGTCPLHEFNWCPDPESCNDDTLLCWEQYFLK